METLPRVGVLEQMRAIEIGQAVSVRGEVGRHPIQNHSDSVLMQVVHEEHEVLWGSEARRGREISGGLVAPGTIKRMLHHRQEFHMGEPHALQVLGQLGRGLTIAQGAIVIVQGAHP